MWLYLPFHQLTFLKENNLESHKHTLNSLLTEKREAVSVLLLRNPALLELQIPLPCVHSLQFQLSRIEVLTLNFSSMFYQCPQPCNSIKTTLLEIFATEQSSLNKQVLNSFMLGNEGTIVSKISMTVSFMGFINRWGREINQVIHIMMKSQKKLQRKISSSMRVPHWGS